MSDSTPRLGLPDLPDTPELYADTVADAFWRLDAFTDLYLKGQFVNTPPSSPADGDAYLIGGAPSGAWSGQPYKIAACRDGGWQFLTPFDGLRAWVEGSGCFIVYQDGVWTDWNALISAAEASIASAATCDIGAAGALFLQVTGTTTVTSLGTVANRLRFLRFAGALTLTHNATTLILPGGVNITTAAGDAAIFASDGSGKWRCRQYSRANGLPVSLASPTVTGTLTAAVANFSGAVAVSYGTPLISVVGSTNAAFRGYNIKDGATTIAEWLAKGSTGEVQWKSGFASFGSYQTWHVDGTERMRLGNDGSFLVGATTVTGAGTIGTHVYTVGTLPAGAKGARAFVSDASSASFAASAAGGGSNNVPVYHDGGGWRVG